MTVYKTAREEILKDWQANLQDFASEHEFPAEATESLQDALGIIGADDRLYAIFRTWEENYWKDPDMDYQTLWATLEALDGTDGISKYTLELLFIIGISRRTRELYEERGISMEVATAAANLTGGADAVIMRHPAAVATIKQYINELV